MAKEPKIIDAEFEVVEPPPTIKSILKGMIGPAALLLPVYIAADGVDRGWWDMSRGFQTALVILATPAVIALGRQVWLLIRNLRERVQHQA